MPQILRTVLQPDTARAADATGISMDLPVNPLSVVLFTIKMLNNTGTIGNYRSFLTVMDAITNLNISYRGASIIDGDLRDLAVLTALLTGWQPCQGNMNSADDDARFITVPILFGRTPYDPLECFPATRRGDLVLSFDTDIADTGYDGLITQIETIELLDAAPEQFVKQTTTTRILNAAGDFDIELPIGNDLLGVMMRCPTRPNTAFTSSIGQVAMKVDNVEVVYSLTNWETLHGDLARRLPNWKYDSHVHHMAGHIHLINAAAGGEGAFSTTHTLGIVDDANDVIIAVNTGAKPGLTGIQAPAITHTLEPEDAGSNLDGYAFLDLDPLKDGQYALKTEGAGRVNLVVTSDVVDTASSRFMPVELVKVGGAGSPPATP